MLRKILSCLFLVLPALALAGPASDESIDELLRVSKVEATLEHIYANVDKLIRQGVAQAAAGKSLNEEQRRVIDAAPAKLAAVLRSELTWEKLRPLYAAIYKESLEQADVDALIAFYRTPGGQAVLAKMPAIALRSASISQMQLQSLMPKLKAAMDEALREAKIATS